MTARFTTLTVAQCSSTQATAPTTVRLVGNVISLLFDDSLRARILPATTSPDERNAWRMAVVDLHLPEATRRPFVVHLRGAMHAVHGRALLRVSADGRTTSRQLFARGEPKSADHTVALHIRRSTQSRDRLRLQVWTESSVSVSGGEAEATVDSVDVLAR